jgi:hypothetical protein
MLERYQHEISTVHNQRLDNRDLANTGALRIAPNSKLASVIQFYPGVMIPAEKDEVESIALGTPGAPITTEDEELTLRLVAARTGVDPAVGGTGGGVVNAKRGIYSAQGTMIAMTASNNRNSLRTNDMRSAHVRLMIKMLHQFAEFGVDGLQLRKYGSDAEQLKVALENYKNGKLGLLIKAATASSNAELSKQNDMLLMQTLANAQQQDIQMMGMMNTPNMPPEVQQYIVAAIAAKNTMLRKIMRLFGHMDVERLAPLPENIKAILESQNGQNQSGPQSNSRFNVGNIPVGTGSGLQFGGGNETSQLPQAAGGGQGMAPVQ